MKEPLLGDMVKIDSWETALKEKDAEIARLQAALDNQIDTIAGLGASVLERDAEIAHLRAERDALQQRVVALEEKIDLCRARTDALEGPYTLICAAAWKELAALRGEEAG